MEEEEEQIQKEENDSELDEFDQILQARVQSGSQIQRQESKDAVELDSVQLEMSRNSI